MNESYHILAKYYNKLMNDYPYEKMISYIIDNVKGNNGLDLACGTGRITAELAYSGFSMTGIDISKDMLNQALSYTRNKGVRVNYINKDINKLELVSEYDFIIATCDAFNYIAPNYIKNVMSYINLHLKENGILIMDISSEYKLKNIIGNQVFYEDYDNLSIIWDNELKSNRIEMNLIFFELNNGFYKRYDEHHTQYVYSETDIVDYLNQSNFKLLSLIDGENFNNLTNKSKRVLIKAGK